MSKLEEMYDKSELAEALEEAIKKMHACEKRVQEFEEDRFCQGGCVVYQLDKINRFKEYFKDIKDGLIQIKAFCSVTDRFQHSCIFDVIDRLHEECDKALGGKE